MLLFDEAVLCLKSRQVERGSDDHRREGGGEAFIGAMCKWTCMLTERIVLPEMRLAENDTCM